MSFYKCVIITVINARAALLIAGQLANRAARLSCPVRRPSSINIIETADVCHVRADRIMNMAHGTFSEQQCENLEKRPRLLFYII